MHDLVTFLVLLNCRYLLTEDKRLWIKELNHVDCCKLIIDQEVMSTVGNSLLHLVCSSNFENVAISGLLFFLRYEKQSHITLIWLGMSEQMIVHRNLQENSPYSLAKRINILMAHLLVAQHKIVCFCMKQKCKTKVSEQLQEEEEGRLYTVEEYLYSHIVSIEQRN